MAHKEADNAENKNIVDGSKINAGNDVHIGDVVHYHTHVENWFTSRWFKVGVVLFLLVSSLIFWNMKQVPTTKSTIPNIQSVPKQQLSEKDKSNSQNNSEKTAHITVTPKIDKNENDKNTKPESNKSTIDSKESEKKEDIYAKTINIEVKDINKSFKISKYEVTVGQYLTYCKKTGKPFPYQHVDTSQINYPMRYINWYEANEYCREMGGELPTLAQWKAAAYFATKPDSLVDDSKRLQAGWSKDNSHGHLKEVGKKKGVNGKGIFDIFGNVEEWIADGPNDNFKYSMGGHYNSFLFRIDLNAEPAINRASDRSKVIGFRVVYN